MGLFGGDEKLLPMSVGELAGQGEFLGLVSGNGMSQDGALKEMNKVAEALGASKVVNVRISAGTNFVAFGDALK